MTAWIGIIGTGLAIVYFLIQKFYSADAEKKADDKKAAEASKIREDAQAAAVIHQGQQNPSPGAAWDAADETLKK